MPKKSKIARRPRLGELSQYVSCGYEVMPLHRWDAKERKGGRERDLGKAPADKAWRTKDYRARDVIARAESTGCNVGVRLRPTDLVLDIDPRNFPEGRDSLDDFVLEVGIDLDDYPLVHTGSGGRHYYMTKPAEILLVDTLADFPGVEFKSVGRQVVAAGSVHPNGKHYAWDDFNPPLADAPAASALMLRVAQRPARAQGDGEAGTVTPEGLSELLAQMEADDFRDHDKWLEIMMASHHATAGEGRQEFIDWSTSDPEYADRAWEIGRRWDSLHVAGSGNRSITVATLYKAVRIAGGEVPRDPASDFDEYTPDPELEKEVKKRVGPLQELNETHCVVDEGGRFKIFSEKFDPVMGRHFHARSSRHDFEDLLGNRAIETRDGQKPLAGTWLRWGRRRQYNGVVFDPERDHPGYLNLWRGWAIEPKRAKWTLLEDLMREVLCGGEDSHYDYVIRWMANMVQRPGTPAEVAIAFRGDKGTGKGTLGRALASLAGRHGIQISNPGHLTGRFNSHLRDCICLFADEAFWAGDKAGESTLKALVTEPTTMYEGKGQNVEQGKNMVHVVMASNSDWVVPAGMDNERRFAVFEVTNDRIGDRRFFERLNRQLYEEDGLAGLLYDLRKVDLNGWHPRSDVPQTEALVQQKLRSMSDLQVWWAEKLSEGFLPMGIGDWEKSCAVRIDVLVDDYVRVASQLGNRGRRASAIQVGHFLHTVCPGLRKERRLVPDEDMSARRDASGRTNYYVFPGLVECRNAFDTRLGGIGAMDW